MTVINYGFSPATGTGVVPGAVAEGQPVNPWFNLLGQLVIFGANLAAGALDINDVNPAIMQRMIDPGITQLTAPGITAEKNAQVYSNGTWSYTIANIDTTVVVRVEGTIDGTTWHNMAASGADTTKTANGTYELFYSARAEVKTRFRFVSETGGANATIDPDFMEGN